MAAAPPFCTIHSHIEVPVEVFVNVTVYGPQFPAGAPELATATVLGWPMLTNLTTVSRPHGLFGSVSPVTMNVIFQMPAVSQVTGPGLSAVDIEGVPF